MKRNPFEAAHSRFWFMFIWIVIRNETKAVCGNPQRLNNCHNRRFWVWPDLDHSESQKNWHVSHWKNCKTQCFQMIFFSKTCRAYIFILFLSAVACAKTSRGRDGTAPIYIYIDINIYIYIYIYSIKHVLLLLFVIFFVYIFNL